MILIAELDKELVIVRCSCMNLSDIKDQWLFALWNVKYHWQTALQLHSGIETFYVDGVAWCVQRLQSPSHLIMSQCHTIFPPWFFSLYCYCDFLTLCGTKWKALGCVEKSTKRPKGVWMASHKICKSIQVCVCVCVCSVALLCSVLFCGDIVILPIA